MIFETPITFLTLVLAAKILVTGLMVGLPFFALPAKRISQLTGYGGIEVAPLYRLYGTAVLALLVGYASGFWAIAAGIFPWGVVAMGVFSNGIGAAWMFATGAWRRNKPVTFFIAAIALALCGAGLNAQWAIQPLMQGG